MARGTIGGSSNSSNIVLAETFLIDGTPQLASYTNYLGPMCTFYYMFCRNLLEVHAIGYRA